MTAKFNIFFLLLYEYSLFWKMPLFSRNLKNGAKCRKEPLELIRVFENGVSKWSGCIWNHQNLHWIFFVFCKMRFQSDLIVSFLMFMQKIPSKIIGKLRFSAFERWQNGPKRINIANFYAVHIFLSAKNDGLRNIFKINISN